MTRRVTEPDQLRTLKGPLCAELLQDAYTKASRLYTVDADKPPMRPTRILGTETTLRKLLHFLVDEFPLSKSSGVVTHGGEEFRFYVPMFQNIPLGVESTLQHNQLLFVNDDYPNDQELSVMVELDANAAMAAREIEITEQQL